MLECAVPGCGQPMVSIVQGNGLCARCRGVYFEHFEDMKQAVAGVGSDIHVLDRIRWRAGLPGWHRMKPVRVG
jgi:hypothetical protein